MNANELADKLMSNLTMEYDCDKYMEQAATMLRQQQAEIEALKAEIVAIEKNTDYWADKSVKELTDEEIADLIYNKVTDSEMIKKALRKAQEK